MYEVGYTKVLQSNKTLQSELLKARSRVVMLDLNRIALSKENEMFKQRDEEWQRRIRDQDEYIHTLHHQMDLHKTKQTSDTIGDNDNFETRVDHDSNRVNYFADAINDQRNSYNALKFAYDELKENFKSLEVTNFVAKEEILQLRHEVDSLKEDLTTYTTEAEEILTSSFLQHYRDSSNSTVEDANDDNLSVACSSSESLVDSLATDAPFDLLRHRVLNLDGRTFELFCCHLFECLGYKAHHCGGACDLGIDFELKDKDGLKTWSGVGQCKRYNRKVGSQDIREFMGSMLGNGCHTGYFLTTSTFTRDAEMARNKSREKNIHIELWNFDTICDKIFKGGYARVLLDRLDSLAMNASNIKLPSQLKLPKNSMRDVDISNNRPISNVNAGRNGINNVLSPSCGMKLRFDSMDNTTECDIENQDCNFMSMDDLLNVLVADVKEEPMSTPFSPDRQSCMSSPRACTTPFTPTSTKHSSLLHHFPQSPSVCTTPSSLNKQDTQLSSKHTKAGWIRERNHDKWDEDEIDALAVLVRRFTAHTGQISWAKMSEWLYENEEKRVCGGPWEPCPILPAHFKKDKLRCRWKNYDSKKRSEVEQREVELSL